MKHSNKDNVLHTTIRKFGNSKGAIIPASLLKSVGLDVNDKLMISAEDGRIIIEPVIIKDYSLNTLLAQSEGVDMRLNDDDNNWLHAPSVGDEIA
jgi:antitoxin component of MazEF toxin-antitoxin module